MFFCLVNQYQAEILWTYGWKTFARKVQLWSQSLLGRRNHFKRQKIVMCRSFATYFSELLHSGEWMKYFTRLENEVLHSGTVWALSTSSTSSSSFRSLRQYTCTVKAVCSGAKIRTLTSLFSLIFLCNMLFVQVKHLFACWY